MRVVIVGAGPAGLYLAYLLARRQRGDEIVVLEQNAADATFGFGVVFSDRALEFLAASDPQSVAEVGTGFESWQDITLVHRGQAIVLDGIGFAAIGRLRLLQILQRRVRSVGVQPQFGRTVQSLDELDGFDLVVGADGVNSLVRRSHEQAFGTTIRHFPNRFAWFGTTRPFATLTQTFVETPQGCFNAHHYRYQPGMSTFIVETDEATFQRSGFETMAPDDARRQCEAIFAASLDGHPLISNNSIWRRFPVVHNARWSSGNCVLIGDALHTAHFSIGSGTRLAMDDAIELDRALAAHPRRVRDALAAFERDRRPIVDKVVDGANASAEWYSHFADHMQLEPIDFALSYVMRSGRISLERLQRLAPAFVARYRRERPGAPA